MVATFRGMVLSSMSKPRGCGGRITQLEAAIEGSPTHHYFSIPGQHRLNRGEEIVAEYENHSGINWVSRYDLPHSNFYCVIGNES